MKHTKNTVKKLNNTDKKIAVYAGSFDPITWGHIEVVKSALKIFDQVIIAVGRSSSKKALFDVETRLELMIEALKHLQGVRVEAFDGLAVAFAQKQNACALIRGLRSEADFSYEMPMAMANKKLNDDLETIFIPTDPKFSFISSTIVREIASYGAAVDAMVPPCVAKKLRNLK